MFKFLESPISTPLEPFGASNRVGRDTRDYSHRLLGLRPCFAPKILCISRLEGWLMGMEKDGVLPALDKVPPAHKAPLSHFSKRCSGGAGAENS